jgi:hypothetical protein
MALYGPRTPASSTATDRSQFWQKEKGCKAVARVYIESQVRPRFVIGVRFPVGFAFEIRNSKDRQ